MHLEIITPEKIIYKGVVDLINLPGSDGSFGILKDHAPIVATLKEGTIKILQTEGANTHVDSDSGELVHSMSDDKEILFDVKGGVVEVSNNKIIVLAE